MTSLAAAVVAATGVLDLLTGSVNVSTRWTILIIALAVTAAGLPAALGERFPPWAALAACWLFIGVTALQTAQAADVTMAVNNLVLYPMMSCYLGWFFDHRTARTSVAAMFLLSGSAVWIGGIGSLFATWANLVLASTFCLEAALYLRAKLDRQIETDPLTGALNRNGLASRLSHELADTARTRAPLAVVAIDLDGFKAINDRFGHAAGDQMLIVMVAHLEHATRRRDSIARTGGDEFVLLLPNTTLTRAKDLLDRLQVDSSVPWTYGLVEAQPSDTEESLIARADGDLYLHKKPQEFDTSIDPLH
ncbi:diguanylate cyclase domain-containing protein [Aeromicrobium sp. CF3.5]|uniref:GGDEF domain-containing protein n=1 Tax=Aeromicrobium sp. CF3.5 TaxID=3373078 RepID=UPI003EE556E7